MRSVIFDLDGTLMDTSGDLLAAANAMFRELGHGDQLHHGPDSGIALRGGRMMLRTGLARVGIEDEALVDRLYAPFVETYDAEINVHTVIYPGAMEAVEALKAAGYGVGICTNKPGAQTEKLLRLKGIWEAFDAVVAADTLPAKKPDPEPLREAARRLGGDPARCCLIGDSDTDRNTAKAAGVPSVLVTFGPSGEDMAALQPEALIGSYTELPGVVEGLNL